jgi:hypothetical protein
VHGGVDFIVKVSHFQSFKSSIYFTEKQPNRPRKKQGPKFLGRGGSHMRIE